MIWLPSLVISIFFVLNAIEKIFHSDQMDKIVTNNAVVIIVGIFLLISTALFLYNKTITAGTTLLASYMTFIVFVHIYKEKPFEVTILIVMCTIFAAYLRTPNLFVQKSQNQ
ncbi:hypothetical protein J8M14_08770 [Aquimarina sp. MMG016]|nr:hypothetical protein [Aquimarina sp. MMG016]